MDTLVNPERQSEKAIHEAARWRLISLLLERPRAGWLSEVRQLATEINDERLREAAESAGEACEGTYLHLFGEGGFVSPREITYRPMEDPGQVLGDIAGFYTSFAFTPQAEDPTDHIAVESGFVGYLWLKEAAAFSDHNQQAVEVTHSARRRFVKDHLSVMAPPWGKRIQDTGISYLNATASALQDAIDENLTI